MTHSQNGARSPEADDHYAGEVAYKFPYILFILSVAGVVSSVLLGAYVSWGYGLVALLVTFLAVLVSVIVVIYREDSPSRENRDSSDSSDNHPEGK